jgi:type III secretory pathway component EscV
MMKCSKVEKLIPLYVGEDLPEQQHKLIEDHLKLCAACYQLYDEFAYSQNLIHASSQPPVIDKMFFPEMRQVIRNEAYIPQASFSFFDYLTVGWHKPLAWAVAPVLLLCLFWLGTIYFNKQSPDVVKKEPVGEQKVTNTYSRPAPSSEEKEHKVDSLNTTLVAYSGNENTKRHSAASASAKLNHRLKVDNSIDFPVLDVYEETPNISEEESDMYLTEVAAQSDEMIRQDIETSDPDVSIIWFSNKHPDPPSSQADEIRF